MAQQATDGAAASRSPLEAQYDELRAVWQDSLSKWTEFASGGMKPGALDPDAIRRLFSPDQWAGLGMGTMEEGLRRVLDGPRYATLWDMDRKMGELQRLALARDQAIARYQTIVARAWASASERFAASFIEPEAEAPATWRALTDRWLQVANATLIDVYRSDEFMATQRTMLRAASDYRLQERGIAEAYCEAAHIPTRTEMDDVQREVVELRRRLRTLTRASPRATTPAVVAKPTATAKTVRAAKKTTRRRRANGART